MVAALRVVLLQEGTPSAYVTTGGRGMERRAKRDIQVIFCVSLLMYAASPTKLLLLTEKLKPGKENFLITRERGSRWERRMATLNSPFNFPISRRKPLQGRQPLPNLELHRCHDP